MKDEEKKRKLDSLDHLRKMDKESMKDKLPKGKGVAVMSVSVSKGKPDDLESAGYNQDDKAPDLEVSSQEAPDELASAEEAAISEEEGPAHEATESSEEEALEDAEKNPDKGNAEPNVPSDVMELVMQMLNGKSGESCSEMPQGKDDQVNPENMDEMLAKKDRLKLLLSTMGKSTAQKMAALKQGNTLRSSKFTSSVEPTYPGFKGNE